ncbi:uncharacterized protein [Battus philenor]|uniref:uncharacterized protein n=1 Tax=Battus philenor TaxID=42288 RepID=UPI0035CFBC0F
MRFCRTPAPCRQKAVSCPAFDDCAAIPILKPEIVIEERRWIPYPLIIRHYIEKPKCAKGNKFVTWYRNQREECRIKSQRRKDAKRLQEAKERMERERCLKELRRLHSHHQSLCCRTQSLPAFSKSTKKTRKEDKIKCKTRAITAKRDKKKCSRAEGSSSFNVCCNLICCFALITVVGLIILYFI